MIEIATKLTLVTRDGRGRFLRWHTQWSDSYVLAFLDILSVQMRQLSQTVKDTGNTERGVGPEQRNLEANAGAANSDWGVVVGTGSGPVSLADYKLQAKINEGAGAGQLQHGAVGTTAPATVANTRKCTIARTFTNSSGGDITVNECGIYVRAQLATYYFCVIRDVAPVLVVNGGSLTVTYTISVTV